MSNSLLSGLTVSEDINNETDNLGGGGPLETGVYRSTITMAYLNKSKGGALGLNLHFKTDANQEFRQTLWVTSGDAKGNKNYYENQQGEKNYLPGFIHADAICMLTLGHGLADMDTEEKVVNVYSPEAKAEVPTKVQVLVDLLGKEVLVGLQKQEVDKRAKNEATGKYEATGEIRMENEIDKIFCARDGFEGMTTSEIRAKATEASFIARWKDKWEGKTRDRTTKQSGNTGAQQGAPAQAGGAAAGGQRKSLFA